MNKPGGGKVFLADKKSLRKGGEEFSRKKQGKIRNKKDNQSWGDTLGPMFKIIEFIDKKRIYRIFRFFPRILIGIGHFLGHFIFGASSTFKRRTSITFRAFYPNASEKRIAKLCDAYAKYLASLFLDILFKLPFMVDEHPERYLSYPNIELLEKALSKGKGVIIPTAHIGEYFHSPGGIFRHPNKYKMTTIASVKNLPMYEFNNRRSFDNLYIYASTKFSKIAPYLERNLRNNHTMVIYHDYSSPKQLRVPVIEGKFPYLINTPQSYISLHKNTGAVILPLICYPDGILGKSKVTFLDNTSIMETSKKYWNSSKQEFHGRLSTEINKVIYTEVRPLAHVWEEMMRFGTLRCADKLEFPASCTIENFISSIQEKMINIIDNSYEPDRNDKGLKNVIDQHLPQIIENVNKPSAILRNHKTKIDLSLMNSKSELIKLCKIAIKELLLKKETESAEIFSDLIPKIRKI